MPVYGFSLLTVSLFETVFLCFCVPPFILATSQGGHFVICKLPFIPWKISFNSLFDCLIQYIDAVFSNLD